MSEFIASRNRDAWFVIRGFRYQIDLTILRWIELKGDQALELEAGEDIDTIAKCIEADSEQSQRLLEQVKHLDKNITLRSPEALAAIANCLEHRQANPEVVVAFRLVSNAIPGVERPSPFDDRYSAIEVWETIRRGNILPADLPVRLAGIRSLLAHAVAPDSFNEGTWQALQTFVAKATDEDLRAFICGFEWSTGGPSSDHAPQDVRQALLRCSICSDEVRADELYRRLFLEVTNVLCRPGRKQLSRARLMDIATLPPLDERDRARIDLLAGRVIDLGSRVLDLEEQARSNERTISSIGTAIRRLLPNLVGAQFYPAKAIVDNPSVLAAACNRCPGAKRRGIEASW